MSNVINISINPEEIKKVILENIMSTFIPVDISSSKNELGNINSEEACKLLDIGSKALTNLIDSGILKPIQMGNGFKFSLWQIKEFQRDYAGYRLVSYIDCVNAKKEIENKKNALALRSNK